MREKRPFLSRMLLRFFLSFLSVLMIPLLLLGALSRKTIREIMVADEYAREAAALSQCAQQIDNELEAITTIVFKASVEQEFSPYRMGDFVQNSLSGISRLKGYKTANSFIREIYLFSAYSDYIFSTNTTYSYGRFLAQKIPGKLSPGDLSELLYQTASKTRYGYMPSADDDAFFLVFSLPSYALTQYAYMIFEIPKKALLAHFDPVTAPASSNLMVLDDGLFVASCKNYPGPLQQKLLSEMSALLPEQTAGSLEFADAPSPFLYQKNESGGFSYLLSFSETDTMEKVDQVVNLFTLYLLLTALIGTFAVYLLSRLNYAPVQKLQTSYRKINLELQDSLPATRSFFIKNLVNGRPFSPEELQLMQNRTSMQFHGNAYFSVIFHLQSTPAGIDASQLADFLSSFCTDWGNGYAASLYEGNIVGIFSCERADIASLKSSLSLLHQNICGQYQIMLTMGIGGIKPDLSGISASFLEASTALDFRFIMGKNTLIYFQDLKLDTYAAIDYSQDTIDRICLLIKNGEKDLLFKTLAALFSKIRANICSMYVAKLLCYDVTNNVIRALKEMAAHHTGFKLPDLIALTTFETVDELEQMLLGYCEAACDFVNALIPPSLSDLAAELIRKNCTRPDFSVSGIAETLAVSPSYLSHIFREQKLVTLNEYVKLYKIDLAKKMLVKTDDSLEKIVHLLGYYDCSSFIRMFKKKEGITPGEYRKQSLL